MNRPILDCAQPFTLTQKQAEPVRSAESFRTVFSRSMLVSICTLSWNFTYTGEMEEVTLPPGSYLLECWGAEGGSFSGLTDLTGGKGGYSTGNVTLDVATTLYIFVGGMGSTIEVTTERDAVCENGGWNGGGCYCCMFLGHTASHSAPGGGATDISLVSSNVTYGAEYRTTRDDESYNERIIVAGGGAGPGCQIGFGGGGSGNAVSLSEYESFTNRPTTGHGGGLTGLGGSPGTQESAGNLGGFGYGGGYLTAMNDYIYGAGGGGWYGGGVAYYSTEDSGGGSGHLKLEGSGLKLEAGETIGGDQTFLSPSGALETGHSGNGYVRITGFRDIQTPHFSLHRNENVKFVLILFPHLLCC